MNRWATGGRVPRGRALWVFGALLAAPIAASGCGVSTPVASPRYEAVVTRVVDGDTVVVRYRDGRTDKVRMIGVDTPETHKPGAPVQCYGPEAEQFTRTQLAGRAVRVELDREPRDRYGRLLAYLYVGTRRFDDELLRLGYGRLLIIRPNGIHAKAMLAAELEARNARRGLWGACAATG